MSVNNKPTLKLQVVK